MKLNKNGQRTGFNRLGVKLSVETINKMKKNSFLKNKLGPLNPGWTGHRTIYRSVHRWLDSRHGQPKLCDDHSGSVHSKTFEWALKKGKTHDYNRKHYKRLCKKHHIEYDDYVRKGWLNRKRK